MSKRRLRVLAAVVFVLPLTSACQKEAEVSREAAPRPRSESTATPRVDEQAGLPQVPPLPQGKQRMLAAILQRGETVWFFKLVGPEAPVSEQAARFREFVGTVRFADPKSPPAWKLPADWNQKPGTSVRFATIEIKTTAAPLDMSVTPLRSQERDFNDYVTANVDRWRDQLGLPETTKAKLFGPGEKSGDLVEVKAGDGGPALLVDLTGEPGANVASGLASSSSLPPGGVAAGSPHPPIGSAAGPGHPPIGSMGSLAGAGLGAPAGKPRLTYETPVGWSAGKTDAMRAAAFVIRDGAKQAEVTAIALGGEAGSLLPNVNRWREQIQLAPMNSEELGKQVKELAIDGAKGSLIEIVGAATAQPRESILGVICKRQDESWFFKMKGDADIVARERGHFESFVKSIKFADR